MELGQEDEATPDEDGVPWGCEADEGAGGEAAIKCDDNEEVDDDVPDVDGYDWVDPEASDEASRAWSACSKAW